MKSYYENLPEGKKFTSSDLLDDEDLGQCEICDNPLEHCEGLSNICLSCRLAKDEEG